MNQAADGLLLVQFVHVLPAANRASNILGKSRHNQPSILAKTTRFLPDELVRFFTGEETFRGETSGIKGPTVSKQEWLCGGVPHVDTGAGKASNDKSQAPEVRGQKSEVRGQRSEVREWEEGYPRITRISRKRTEGRRKIPSPKFQIPNAEYQAYPTKAVRAEKSLRLSGGHERV